MSRMGSFQNQQMAQMQSKDQFEVGDGATLVMYTDRKACTVIDIQRNGRVVTIQEDHAIRTDTKGMSESQVYRFEPNPEGTIHSVTKRRDGTYKVRGSQTPVVIGHRSHYYDYSF